MLSVKKKRDRLGTQREQKTKHKVYVISCVVDEIELDTKQTNRPH